MKETTPPLPRLDVRDDQFAARYEFRGEIGRGGMGIVNLCHDGRLRRDVAMKVTSVDDWTPQHEARFEREARIQGQLEHPSVVPVYDMGTTDTDRTFFTMKQVRGRTLKSILVDLDDDDPAAAAAFNMRRLLSAFISVCNAVAVAHRRGIVHRDLKPANIMLGEYGEVYVLDWGVATVASDRRETADWDVELKDDELTRASSGAVGTPRYMAPEQREGIADALTDVYALGVVLRDIVEAVATPRQRVDALRVVAETACSPIRSRRHASAEELRDAVEAYLDGARDDTRRRQLSARHAEEARTLGENTGSMSSYRRAMREVGRALALDPSNAQAMETFVHLLDRPPQRIPPEIERSLRSSAEAGRRTATFFAGVTYIAVLLLVPLGLWAGHSTNTALVVSASWVLAIVAYLGTGRIWRASQAGMFPAITLTTIATALLSTVAGWLAILPALATANSAAFAMQLGKRLRPLACVLGCLSFTVPALVAANDAFPDALRSATLPSLHEQLDGPDWIFLTVAVCLLNVSVTLLFGSYRDALEAAEFKLQLRSWQHRQLLSDER